MHLRVPSGRQRTGRFRISSRQDAAPPFAPEKEATFTCVDHPPGGRVRYVLQAFRRSSGGDPRCKTHAEPCVGPASSTAKVVSVASSGSGDVAPTTGSPTAALPPRRTTIATASGAAPGDTTSSPAPSGDTGALGGRGGDKPARGGPLASPPSRSPRCSSRTSSPQAAAVRDGSPPVGR
jgi:hypothetical protein